jgi:hypothetical protein
LFAVCLPNFAVFVNAPEGAPPWQNAAVVWNLSGNPGGWDGMRPDELLWLRGTFEAPSGGLHPRDP